LAQIRSNRNEKARRGSIATLDSEPAWKTLKELEKIASDPQLAVIVQFVDQVLDAKGRVTKRKILDMRPATHR
jgi:hypothetical protein